MLTEEDILRLRIGYTTIAVKEVAAIDKGYDYGEFDSVKKLIEINRELDTVDKVNTFIHEIFHAILWERGVTSEGGLLDEKDKDEEFLINTLTNGFIQVIQDNPIIIKVLSMLNKTK